MMTTEEKSKLQQAADDIKNGLHKLATAIHATETYNHETRKLLLAETLVNIIDFDDLINKIAKETMPF